MPVAVNINARKRYVLECDRKLPEEKQTTYILKNLPLEERIKIEDEQAQYGVSTDPNPEAKADMTIKQHKRNLELVKLGLDGWENFKDDEGKEVVFETVALPGGKNGSINIVSRTSLSRLALEWIDELGKQIGDMNKVTPEEVKN